MINSFKDKHRFLSNFWYIEVTYKGLVFPTVENAYQYAKLRNFHIDAIPAIYQSVKPSEAKNFAREASKDVMADDRIVWYQKSTTVMFQLLTQKFGTSTPQHRQLREKLQQTGTEPLVEGNYWHDNFYGVCYCQACELERRMENPQLGRNALGKLLMIVRDNIMLEDGYWQA